MQTSLVVTAATLVASVACGGDSTSSYGGGGGGCTPTATQICMLNALFDPATKNVSAVTTLTWKNGDPFGHTTTSNLSNPPGCPTWDHAVSAGQASAEVTFATAGVTCQYYCSIHATPTTGAMRASLNVQ